MSVALAAYEDSIDYLRARLEAAEAALDLISRRDCWNASVTARDYFERYPRKEGNTK